MACQAYDPESTLTGGPWIQLWIARVLNDSCLQASCAHVCANSRLTFEEPCIDCLKVAKCAQAAGCLEQVGTEDDFDRAAQAVQRPYNAGEIVGFAVAGLFGLALVVALVRSRIRYRQSRERNGNRSTQPRQKLSRPNQAKAA